ncbi:MAG: OmpA family protein [Cellvibrionaceae bacterium]|nr:OmpA family protein [Cellvibrionaceae bacterium]
MNTKTIKATLFSLLMSINALSFAGNTTMQETHLGQRILDKQKIIDLLAPAEGSLTPLKLRGIKIIQPQAAEAAAPRSISMQINFEFNSHQLTGASLQQLKPVGEALASQQLSRSMFAVEGHTDAVGSENYNLALSKKRAETVKSFFIQRYGIEARRIAVQARGEYELFDKQNPNSGANRRVRIVAR